MLVRAAIRRIRAGGRRGRVSSSCTSTRDPGCVNRRANFPPHHRGAGRGQRAAGPDRASALTSATRTPRPRTGLGCPAIMAAAIRGSAPRPRTSG